MANNTNVLKGEPVHLVKDSRGEVATTVTVETGAKISIADKIGIQQGDPDKDGVGVAIGMSTPNHNLQLPPPTRNSQVSTQ